MQTPTSEQGVDLVCRRSVILVTEMSLILSVIRNIRGMVDRRHLLLDSLLYFVRVKCILIDNDNLERHLVQTNAFVMTVLERYASFSDNIRRCSLFDSTSRKTMSEGCQGLKGGGCDGFVLLI